jgi:hypothetical protein
VVALRIASVLGAALLAAAGCRPPSAADGGLQVVSGVDHSAWERLLRTYVDEHGLVAYEAWKRTAAGREALDRYIERLGAAAEPPAEGAERAATLLNAYNALVVSWILDNHPTATIRATDDPFGARRHRLGGRLVSLDDIEHRALRTLAGYRVHAALVCAARSCPPLAREAYAGAALEAQLDRAMGRWLAREDLNRFSGDEVRLSMIFRWFGEDFEAAGGLREVLRRHAPPSARPALAGPELDVEFIDYDWSLNEQTAGR